MPPHVATVAGGRPFVVTLARGLLAWERERLADTLLLLPSRRACLAARAALAREAGGAPLLLPRLLPVGEPDEAELALSGEIELALPPPMPPLRRRLSLMRLILARTPGMAHEQAIRLAGELERFLDELHHEEVGIDRLTDLVPAELAEHWQESVAFLTLLQSGWPEIVKASGFVEAAARRRLLLDALVSRWRADPPRHPVVAAGITGSLPAVARLLAMVAQLPQGLVLLEGLDRTLDEASWRAIGPDHPQFALRALLDLLGIARDAVAMWPEASGAAAATPRQRLWSEAFRPAATTDLWRTAPLPHGTAAGVELDLAPDPASEALRIAVRLRRALETPGTRAALVTPSRSLGRRVAVELQRWNIRVDDSAGVPLDQTPPGSFLLLAAQMAAPSVAPALLLAALKHPLATGEGERREFLDLARRLERLGLRGPRLEGGLTGLLAALPQDETATEVRDWLARIAAAARPLTAALAAPRVELREILETHLAFAAWLAGSDAAGGGALWAHEAGRAAHELMAALVEAADAAGVIPPAAYPPLLAILLAAANVRPDRPGHPRLAILGPIEARLIEADLVVLGGLNEGTWPQAVDAGPWLNRAMRGALGLPPAERAIGSAALDLVLAAGAREVVLSRAAKDEDGTPTVASRWLARLEACLAAGGNRLDADPLPAQLAAALDQPRSAPRPVARPAPRPPLAARPRDLSASDIERLIRDPYAVYAKHVLELRPLEPLDADPGAAERGQIVHAALYEFVSAWPDTLPNDPAAELRAIGRRLFARLACQPQVLAIWWPRFERLAAWLAAIEQERRTRIARIAAEVSGMHEISAPGGPFRLRARADRIELGQDGRLTILDYKTGTPPKAREVQLGLAPQLAIEALIAENGGFKAFRGHHAGAALFLELKGLETQPGATTDPLRDEPDVRAWIEMAADGIRRLIAHFDDPSTPYLPVPRPEIAPRRGDYDHLARIGEWLGTEAGP